MLLKACNGVYSRWLTCLQWSGREWRHTAPWGLRTRWRTLLRGLHTLYTTERNKRISNCMLQSRCWAIINLLWKHLPHQQEWCSGSLQQDLCLVSKLQHCHLIAAVHCHAPAQKAARVKTHNGWKTCIFYNFLALRCYHFYKLQRHKSTKYKKCFESCQKQIQTHL